MGITVLGSIGIEGLADRLGRRDRVVLGVLALRPGHASTLDRLVDALWGEAPPKSAEKVAQGCVMRLRKLLGREAIETSELGYTLALVAEDVDAHRFERLLGRGRELLALGETDRASYLLGEALGLWHGRPYLELEGWSPADFEASRLVALRLDAEELAVAAALDLGHHDDVAAQAFAMVQAEPTRERRWALLARAHYQAGRQEEALRAIRDVTTMLRDTLGLDPNPDLVELEQAILRQDVSVPALPAGVRAGDTCPYKGLLPYDVEDGESFFGRDADLANCLRVLTGTGTLTVVGPSGCGKSSLVRAGIAAALGRHGQQVVIVTPGVHPVEALTAPPGHRDRPVLVVDQFEEAFSTCEDVAERDQFVAALVEHAATAPLVMAARADSLAELAAYPSLARLVESGLHLLGAMPADDLRAAIVSPARQVGLIIEPGLVDLLLRDVEDEPGALPLLSHALLETWKRREGNTLTVDGYRDSGAIRGAVAQSAERVYAGIEPGQRQLMRHVLLRLVTYGGAGEPVRSRVPRRLLGADPQIDSLVDALVSARLVSSDAGVLEVSHEALARAWPRLHAWLEDDVEGQRIRHHLTAAADAWDSMGRPDSELYRGVRLARALEWRSGRGALVTDTEAAFLDASQEATHLEERSAEERARHQARVNRRLRAVLAVAAVLLLLTTAAGIYAVRQTRKAETAADTAQHAAVAEQARRVGALAPFAPDLSESLLLAVQGVRLDDSPETRVNLLAAMAREPNLVRSVPAAGDYLSPMSVSADGGRIAAPDDDGAVHLYDAATGGLLHSYDTLAGESSAEQVFAAVSFSPSDEYLAVGTEVAPPARLLDPHTLAPTGPALEMPGGGVRTRVNDLDFSADGRYLAAATQHRPVGQDFAWDQPSSVVVWDLRHPDRPPDVVRTKAGLQGIVLSPDGRTVYTSLPVTAYDVATGRTAWSTEHESWLVLDVSPNGKLLASEIHDEESFSSKSGPIRLTDARTGETVRVLRGHEDQPFDLRFSSDGRRLASVSTDGELIVWNVSTGAPLVDADTSEASFSVSFSPDGHRVYTGGDAGLLRTWDLNGDQQFLRRTFGPAGSQSFVEVNASPDGTRLAFTTRGKSESWILFLDTLTGKRTSARVPGEIYGVPWSPGTWHPDGRHYAVYNESGVITVLDAQTGQQLARRPLVDRLINSMDYVDKGERLLVGDDNDHMWFLDAETLRPTGPELSIASHCCATGAPDGGTAIVFEQSNDGTKETWRLIDTGSGKVLNQATLNLRAYSASFSPDGERVAVTGYSGEVVTIDVSSGRVKRAPATGHAAEAYWVRWSPDGSRIVSGASDGTVSLWDGDSMDLLGTVLTPHDTDPVPVSPAFTGEDQVTVATYDGHVYRWDTDFDHTLAFACQMAGRNLTSGEWERALPDLPYEETCRSS